MLHIVVNSKRYWSGAWQGRRTAASPWLLAAAVLGSIMIESPVQAQPQPPDPAAGQASFDLAGLQGILAIQQLDGWLLYDHAGQNPIARELIQPAGEPTRRWFYLIPTEGEPVALIHRIDARSFERVPGRKIVYTAQRQLEQGLTVMLAGKKRLAMEYSPKAELPSLSRVDAGTLEQVRSRKVKVRSSAELVQFARSLWGNDGRLSHHVAAHHLDELRKAALVFVARGIQRGNKVRESDVQKLIANGYRVRGLVGPPAVVAAGKHTADPYYLPGADSDAVIEKGDLLVLGMSARVQSEKRTIVAEVTWVAFVGDRVPDSHASMFGVLVQARDAALALIEDRVGRRRAIKGFEVDRQARKIISQAGHGDKFIHRTGHSLDTQVHGGGANLDDYETHDARNLVVGSGYAIAPGIYSEGESGMRAEIDVYLGPTGVEVTTARQTEITAILASP